MEALKCECNLFSHLLDINKCNREIKQTNQPCLNPMHSVHNYIIKLRLKIDSSLLLFLTHLRIFRANATSIQVVLFSTKEIFLIRPISRTITIISFTVKLTSLTSLTLPRHFCLDSLIPFEDLKLSCTLCRSKESLPHSYLVPVSLMIVSFHDSVKPISLT